MSKQYDSTANTYLTVGQAARQLSVHPSTVRRWISQGKLPAYRLGEKRVGVRQTDLEQVVSPLVTHATKTHKAGYKQDFRPLTEDEQKCALKAMEEVGQMDQELLKRRGGKLLPSSAELLNRLREERTRELMSDRIEQRRYLGMIPQARHRHPLDRLQLLAVRSKLGVRAQRDLATEDASQIAVVYAGATLARTPDEQACQFDLQPGLLADLSHCGLLRSLARLHTSTRQSSYRAAPIPLTNHQQAIIPYEHDTASIGHAV